MAITFRAIYTAITYIHIYACQYANLPRNVIVRLTNPQSGDIHDQETFLAPSPDKWTHNYDTKCSDHHPSQWS